MHAVGPVAVFHASRAKCALPYDLVKQSPVIYPATVSGYQEPDRGFWPGTSRTRTSSHDAPDRTPSTLGSRAWAWWCAADLLAPHEIDAHHRGGVGLTLSPQACSHPGSFGA